MRRLVGLIAILVIGHLASRADPSTMLKFANNPR